MKIVHAIGLTTALFFGPAAEAQTITRQQVVTNVAPYRDLSWTMNQRNAEDNCTVSGTRIRTPFAAQTTRTGMPYNWGGGSSLTDFTNGIAGNGRAGNKCTSADNSTFTTKVANTFGVDCSGFVTNMWGLSGHPHGTGTLTNIATELPIRNGVQVPMRPGDVFNKPGSHVVLLVGTSSTGAPIVAESRGGDWKVIQRTATWAEFSTANGYRRLRYKNLQDGGFARVDQGITVTPSTVRRGQSATFTFRLKETDGARITLSRVTAAVVSGSGQQQFDVNVKTNVALLADGTWTYTASAPVNLAPGTYRAVARGNVASWFDIGTTGAGATSVSFIVTQ